MHSTLLKKTVLDKVSGRIWGLSIIVPMVVWGLFLRFQWRLNRAFHDDEIWQFSIMTGTFREMLKILPEREFCSYLSGDFYLIFPFYKIFGRNELGLAIPHIMITILGFYFLYLVCRIHCKNVLGFIIAFSIMSLNATLIQHSFEIRVYAVLPTLALASYYFMHLLVAENARMSMKKKIGIGIFFILLIWFHVYGILIAFFPAVYFLTVKIKDPLFKAIFVNMVKFFSVVLLVAMPLWIVSVFGKHLGYAHVDLGPGGVFRFIPDPLSDLKGFLGGVFGNLLGYKKLYFLYLGVPIAFALSKRKRTEQISFLIILIFLPILLLLSVAINRNYWFVQRQFIWVIPFCAVFLGWCWGSILEYVSATFNFQRK